MSLRQYIRKYTDQINTVYKKYQSLTKYLHTKSIIYVKSEQQNNILRGLQREPLITRKQENNKLTL